MIKKASLSLIILVTVCLLIPACKTCKKSETTVDTQKQQKIDNPVVGDASPPLMVYKTVKNYNKNVPVILTEDKTAISSYPDVKDIYYKGEFSYPTEVADGYLIDNRGINKNVAFIDLTYEAYSKFSETPSAEALYSMILGKDPLLELYDLQKFSGRSEQDHYKWRIT